MFKRIEAGVRFPDETMVTVEYFGRISSGDTGISIGHLHSEAGWSEARQRPDFDEYTLVLSGELHLTAEDGSVLIVRANQGVLVPKGDSVQYATPTSEGADYISVCIPAFSMELAHRDGMETD